MQAHPHLKRPGTGRVRVVGLDIGSSAVRAVEVAGSGDKRRLARFAQVGLPLGAVTEGEVRDIQATADALKRLWSEGRFSTRKVVVAVGGQRVIVREADVTAMSAEDFRSAMSFEVQDLIPIPTSEALLDFQILGASPKAADGRDRMRILLAAADRTAVDQMLATLRAAGLDPVGVDVPPTAMLRAARADQITGTVGLITIGADLTNVTVRAGERGLFSRTLGVGAAQLTRGLSIRLGVAPAEAEAVKRYAGEAQGGSARAAALVGSEAAPLVEQVIESLDYFESQSGSSMSALLISGGGSVTAGLPELLAGARSIPVVRVDPFAGMDCSGSGLSAADLDRARAVGLCATGLAAWSWEAPDRRLSLLPPEIAEARRRRQAAIAGAAAVGVLAAGLTGTWYTRHQQITSTKSTTATVVAQGAVIKGSGSALGAVNSYIEAVEGRQKALSATATGLDWPALIRQISAAMPANTTLSDIQVASAAPVAATGASTAAATSAPSSTLTLSVTAVGGEDTVAAWLRAMATVPALSNVWVGSSSSDGTKTTFICSATISAKAPVIAYAWEAKK